ncbi:MAG TPA: uracil-DNA glycosylase [Lacipirellulaceae bacterium]|nr:uracil-DNA glycosylase [Lacipirellulaceae bacterium]
MAISPDSARRAIRQKLESLQGAGVRQLPKGKRFPPKGPLGPAAAEPSGAAPTGAGDSAREDDREATVLAQRDETADGDWATSQAPTLAVLQQEVAGCTMCGELARTRTQTVFGVGDPDARLCFLGEAPGADEDRLGEPFVGRAGQLLNKILEACHLRREDVYILNILKCRPPGNRNPAPDEAAHCRRYLDRQLELIRPEFICCLGAVAVQNLLGTTEAIGKLRGRVLEYKDFKVVATYHPAYLLRNPSAKKYAWDDMKLLMRAMGTPVD